MSTRKRKLTGWLEEAPEAVLTGYAMLAAFSTYFCMYAFRKPFAAAQFADLKFLGTGIDLKTAFVISQIVGYTLSKYIGIKVCSEATRQWRAWLLVGLILSAEIALLLFAALPPDWKVLAIFCNGLPLGMVWGLVVWYLEGRRTSDVLLAGLCCSFILSSGAVKDVGRYLMSFHGVSEAWMPFTTGLVFLAPFLVSTWLLNQLPGASAADRAARTVRAPMDGVQRGTFVKHFLPGLVLLVVVYFFLTAYRDFRDNFGVEIFKDLNVPENAALFTKSETFVAFGVMAAMARLNLIKNNLLGLIGAYVLMAGGLLLLGAGTLLLDRKVLDGFWWMVVMGFGSYLAYVPYNAVLFDRLMATTRFTGTAVFAIYLADAIGYTGSVGVQVFKDLVQSQVSRLDFFRGFSYLLSIIGTVLLLLSCLYFVRKHRPPKELPAPVSKMDVELVDTVD
jgi:hypothetical protein